jgi:hypothetical protein
MYINSNNQGLHHPSFKFLVFAKKVGSPQWPIAQDKFQIQNDSANSKQNLKKNVANEIGAQTALIDEKSQRYFLQILNCTIVFQINPILAQFISE